MKSMIILILGTGLFLSCTFGQTANFSILQMPREGFWKLGLMNHSTETITTSLAVKFMLEGRLVHTVSGPSVLLHPGSNLIDLQRMEGGTQLGNGLTLTTSAAEQQRLEICVELYMKGAKFLSQCDLFQQALNIPLHLVYPFDQDVLETSLPMMSWSIPSPVSHPSQLRYRLRLVEVLGYHTPQSAMANAPALIDRADLTQNVIPYSPSYRKLEAGHTYAWQVEAYDGSGFVGRSELWSFRLKAEKETTDSNAPFVELRKRLDSGFYPARGQVRFKHDCQYGESTLDFVVTNHRGEQIRTSGKQLEKVGKNLFTLHLPPGSGLIEGQMYHLEVTNPKGESTILKFKYFYPKS
ncbi:MAG: hypothetical protein AAF587_17470 [Bacteroidota bacterium]